MASMIRMCVFDFPSRKMPVAPLNALVQPMPYLIQLPSCKKRKECVGRKDSVLTNDLSKIQRSLEFLPLICNVPSRRKISYGKRKARLIFIFAKFFLRSQFWLHNEMKVLKFFNHGGFIPK